MAASWPHRRRVAAWPHGAAPSSPGAGFRVGFRHEELSAAASVANGGLSWFSDVSRNARGGERPPLPDDGHPFCYGVIQITEAKEQYDSERDGYDGGGGASWLHAGLAIWGRRSLSSQLEGILHLEAGPAHGTADGLGLRTEHGPGDFHLGNVVAPRRRAVHFAPEGAEPFFRRDPTARRGYHVTCMIRCGAFREQKGRGTVRGGAPSPIAAYDIVNTAAAQFSATGPAWGIPSLSETRRTARELGEAAAPLEVGGKKRKR